MTSAVPALSLLLASTQTVRPHHIAQVLGLLLPSAVPLLLYVNLRMDHFPLGSIWKTPGPTQGATTSIEILHHI